MGHAGRGVGAGAGGGSWWLLLPLVALHGVILWATESPQQKAHHLRSQCLTWAPIGSSPRARRPHHRPPVDLEREAANGPLTPNGGFLYML
jgi:hypothetical protein